MNEVFLSSATIGVVISIAAYEIGVYLKKKTKQNKIHTPT